MFKPFKRCIYKEAYVKTLKCSFNHYQGPRGQRGPRGATGKAGAKVFSLHSISYHFLKG